MKNKKIFLMASAMIIGSVTTELKPSLSSLTYDSVCAGKCTSLIAGKNIKQILSNAGYPNGVIICNDSPKKDVYKSMFGDVVNTTTINHTQDDLFNYGLNVAFGNGAIFISAQELDPSTGTISAPNKILTNNFEYQITIPPQSMTIVVFPKAQTEFANFDIQPIGWGVKGYSPVPIDFTQKNVAQYPLWTGVAADFSHILHWSASGEIISTTK